MAQETIQMVKQAELAAEQKEREALNQAKELIGGAEKEAKELISSMTRKSMDEAKRASEQADNERERTLLAARERAEKEIALLYELLKQKEDKAIELVVSELIS